MCSIASDSILFLFFKVTWCSSTGLFRWISERMCVCVCVCVCVWERERERERERSVLPMLVHKRTRGKQMQLSNLTCELSHPKALFGSVVNAMLSTSGHTCHQLRYVNSTCRPAYQVTVSVYCRRLGTITWLVFLASLSLCPVTRTSFVCLLYAWTAVNTACFLFLPWPWPPKWRKDVKRRQLTNRLSAAISVYRYR